MSGYHPWPIPSRRSNDSLMSDAEGSWASSPVLQHQEDQGMLVLEPSGQQRQGAQESQHQQLQASVGSVGIELPAFEVDLEIACSISGDVAVLPPLSAPAASSARAGVQPFDFDVPQIDQQGDVAAMQVVAGELGQNGSPSAAIEAAQPGMPPSSEEAVQREAPQAADAAADMDTDAFLRHILPHEDLVTLVKEMVVGPPSVVPATPRSPSASSSQGAPSSLTSSVAAMQSTPGQTLGEFQASSRRGHRFFKKEVLAAHFTRTQFTELRSMLGARLYDQFSKERRRHRDKAAARKTSSRKKSHMQRLRDTNAELRRRKAALERAKAKLKELSCQYSSMDAFFAGL